MGEESIGEIMIIKAKYYHWGSPGLKPGWEEIELVRKDGKRFRKLGPIALEGFNIAEDDKNLIFIAEKLSIDTTKAKEIGIGVKHAYALKYLPIFLSNLEETD